MLKCAYNVDREAERNDTAQPASREQSPSMLPAHSFPVRDGRQAARRSKLNQTDQSSPQDASTCWASDSEKLRCSQQCKMLAAMCRLVQQWRLGHGMQGVGPKGWDLVGKGVVLAQQPCGHAAGCKSVEGVPGL